LYTDHCCTECGVAFRLKVLAKTIHEKCPVCRKTSKRRKTVRPGNITWNDDVIRKELEKLISQGKSPSDIAQENSRLYAALMHRYRNLADSCEQLGLPEPVKGYNSAYQIAGFEFEDILGHILTELGYGYTRPHVGHCRPDFAINSRWFDAKLSEWTINTCGTVRKYEPHCRSLTIIFARGRDIDRMVSDKTRLIHVNRYIKQLPRSQRGYFYAKIREINDELANQGR
jgi:hypothetical protein